MKIPKKLCIVLCLVLVGSFAHLIHALVDMHRAGKFQVLKPNENGVAFFKDTPCQHSNIDFRDITFHIISSYNTYAKRIPIIDQAWVADAMSRGAKVIITVGPGESNFTDPRVVRMPRDNNGGCGSPPQGHCDLIFKEHSQMLAERVRTRLVVNCDDDTVYHLDRYLETLRCLPKYELWGLGDCQKAHWEPRSFCGGGASITYPRTLLPYLSTCDSGLGRADDVQVSWCLMDAGAVLINHPTFRYADDYCSNEGYEWVSVHHVFMDPHLCTDNRLKTLILHP